MLLLVFDDGIKMVGVTKLTGLCLRLVLSLSRRLHRQLTEPFSSSHPVYNLSILFRGDDDIAHLLSRLNLTSNLPCAGRVICTRQRKIVSNSKSLNHEPAPQTSLVYAAFILQRAASNAYAHRLFIHFILQSRKTVAVLCTWLAKQEGR